MEDIVDRSVVPARRARRKKKKTFKHRCQIKRIRTLKKKKKPRHGAPFLLFFFIVRVFGTLKLLTKGKGRGY